MKNEGRIGAATLLAIAAMVGVSLQTGSNQAERGGTDRNGAAQRSRVSVTGHGTQNERPGCDSLKEQLEDFLGIENLTLPGSCYEPGGATDRQLPAGPSGQTSQLKFVIAFLPDPVHTHSSALFDQFAVAIQEAAQDEKYDFDSSWLPWDNEESSYARLADEKASVRDKELKETQPGIILFRKAPACSGKGDCKDEVSSLYGGGLIVFVVGEDATHGIHQEQFQSALEWIAALQPEAVRGNRLAILGPTFSGSFPSVAHAFSDPKIAQRLHLGSKSTDRRLALYSGSVSDKASAQFFQAAFHERVVFHSFVQDDKEILRRFCKYITTEQPGFDVARVAIISEDETAYGGAIPREEGDKTADGKSGQAAAARGPLELFYPRDISALRSAYQTKALFDAGAPAQPAETQRRSLPTDLADPSGKVHDSIRTFGGGQTPLAQEAHLMEIVGALRELHARYILLRSSSTLDQLFLANFLRRTYPDGRIVIVGSDLMFVRERGSTGLSGAMTLSTYPLFPLERDWTEHQSLPAPDRTFAADTSEGTYVALRLLLNDRSMMTGEPDSARCRVRDQDEETIFLPSVDCGVKSPIPIPDYSAPFWTLNDQCGEMHTPPQSCPYAGPATWLSVIGVNRFWPLASLTKDTPNGPRPDARTTERANDRKNDPGGLPEMPYGMKVFLLAVAGFAVFHAWCNRPGSYVFRATIAGNNERHHTLLVFGGSCFVAFVAIVTGWGSGMFSVPPAGLPYPWFAFCCVTFAWFMACGAILANGGTPRAVSKGFREDKGAAEDVCKLSPGGSDLPGVTQEHFASRGYVASGLFAAATVLFCLSFVLPLERALLIENRVLTYWRAMHLVSGVSPIVPMFSVFIGLYLWHWFTLRGLELFGPDRPCLPPKVLLALKDDRGNTRHFLRMFSQEDAAEEIERAATAWSWTIAAATAGLSVLFAALAFVIAGGVPVRSLGSQNYAVIFLVWLDICCSLFLVETYRFHRAWDELRRLLVFLDRLPLRRTLAALRGFSWGSVWKMSGNVLEARYKVMSRQMECMNHTITALEEHLEKTSDAGASKSLDALQSMRRAGFEFADWYSNNYLKSRAGDLTAFSQFQRSVATASGTLLTQLLLPAWRTEGVSLLVAQGKDEKEEGTVTPPPQAKQAHIRNAEEFVCLSYLGFIQNVLGRLRTMAMAIIVLFVACAAAISSYPFDPRQPLSAVLIALFAIGSAVIVKVYADMHRDATLSHVTNTKPGELGAEFWFKIFGFGFAPLIGLLTRIFPSVTDFIFSWLQPGMASLK